MLGGCGLVLDLRPPEDAGGTSDGGLVGDAGIVDGGRDAESDAGSSCALECAWSTCEREICVDGTCVPLELELDVCEGSCPPQIIACDSEDSCDPPDDVFETCNGLDDDCDGTVDEDVIAPEEICDAGVAPVCADGTWSCPGEVDPPDGCGDGDDDVDGRIDEDCEWTPEECIWVQPGADGDGAIDTPVGDIAAAAGVAEERGFDEFRVCLMGPRSECPTDGAPAAFTLPDTLGEKSFIVEGGFRTDGTRGCAREGYRVEIDGMVCTGRMGLRGLSLAPSGDRPPLEITAGEVFLEDVWFMVDNERIITGNYNVVNMHGGEIHVRRSRIEFPVVQNSIAFDVGSGWLDIAESCGDDVGSCRPEDSSGNGVVSMPIGVANPRVSNLRAVALGDGTLSMRDTMIEMGSPIESDDATARAINVSGADAEVSITGSSITFALGAHPAYGIFASGGEMQVVDTRVRGRISSVSAIEGVAIEHRGRELALLDSVVEVVGEGAVGSVAGVRCDGSGDLAVTRCVIAGSEVEIGAPLTEANGIVVQSAVAFVDEALVRAAPERAGAAGSSAVGLSIAGLSIATVHASTLVGGCAGDASGTVITGGVTISRDSVHVGIDCDVIPAAAGDAGVVGVGMQVRRGTAMTSLSDTFSGGHLSEPDSACTPYGAVIGSEADRVALINAAIGRGGCPDGAHVLVPTSDWTPTLFSHVTFLGPAESPFVDIDADPIPLVDLPFLGRRVWHHAPEAHFADERFDGPLSADPAFHPSPDFSEDAFMGHPTIHSFVDHDGAPRPGPDGRVTVGAFEYE